jgi:hypothetical protein
VHKRPIQNREKPTNTELFAGMNTIVATRKNYGAVTISVFHTVYTYDGKQASMMKDVLRMTGSTKDYPGK